MSNEKHMMDTFKIPDAESRQHKHVRLCRLCVSITHRTMGYNIVLVIQRLCSYIFML